MHANKLIEHPFRVSWYCNQSNLISSFTSLLRYDALVDVTLAAEGRHLKAHKVVLSACSTYFESLFTSNPCQHPIVILKDVAFNNLKMIIDYIYYGEMFVSEEQLSHLSKTADMLGISIFVTNENSNRLNNLEDQSSHRIDTVAPKRVHKPMHYSTESQQQVPQQEQSQQYRQRCSLPEGSVVAPTERMTEKHGGIERSKGLSQSQMDGITVQEATPVNLARPHKPVNSNTMKEIVKTKTQDDLSQESIDDGIITQDEFSLESSFDQIILSDTSKQTPFALNVPAHGKTSVIRSLPKPSHTDPIFPSSTGRTEVDRILSALKHSDENKKLSPKMTKKRNFNILKPANERFTRNRRPRQQRYEQLTVNQTENTNDTSTSGEQSARQTRKRSDVYRVALEAIKSGKISTIKAVEMYGLSYRSLWKQLRKWKPERTTELSSNLANKESPSDNATAEHLSQSSSNIKALPPTDDADIVQRK
ncbi:Protein tramtrack, alpha isoform [Pseudolycoriella hygida]|uniref:Protein tramtrack, alpha isoform n=1 Tax=Pseudolycoriella hygida TaxID=35572 RepID=A0A9Q0MZ13_9DIPT|nr:Protein tramtrack, alpha isoform [Pseudolycoriella hygida]